MYKAIEETYRRRRIQEKYNQEHGITPQTIQKDIRESISISKEATGTVTDTVIDFEANQLQSMTRIEKQQLINQLEKQMKQAAKELRFEDAMMLRDAILEIKTQIK
jgi:excinuclease ABC subunit B